MNGNLLFKHALSEIARLELVNCQLSAQIDQLKGELNILKEGEKHVHDAGNANHKQRSDKPAEHNAKAK